LRNQAANAVPRVVVLGRGTGTTLSGVALFVSVNSAICGISPWFLVSTTPALRTSIGPTPFILYPRVQEENAAEGRNAMSRMVMLSTNILFIVT
jgi:hypothetical protein